MGLLDEAIREHLELKRRRGGDPAEIERAEREALGPVRRHPEGAEPVEFAESGDLSELPELSEPPAFDEPEFDEPTGLDEPTALHEPPAPEHDPDFDEPPLERPGAAEAPPTPHRAGGFVADEPAPPSDEADDHLGHETAEYHLGFEDEGAEHDVPGSAGHAPERGHEPEPGARDPHAPAPREGEPNEEDMLEETPEFLQDAPEHDRLWFEQRPPRDFDFDG
jgi:hypothetical protein